VADADNFPRRDRSQSSASGRVEANLAPIIDVSGRGRCATPQLNRRAPIANQPADVHRPRRRHGQHRWCRRTQDAMASATGRSPEPSQFYATPGPFQAGLSFNEVVRRASRPSLTRSLDFRDALRPSGKKQHDRWPFPRARPLRMVRGNRRRGAHRGGRADVERPSRFRRDRFASDANFPRPRSASAELRT
jgi:hypothetical protein